MRKLMMIAAPLALAACAQEAPEPEAVTEEVAATTEAVMTTANGSAVPLTTENSNADGPTGITTLNADGTYADTGVDGEVTEGTWEVVDGKTCFTTGEEEAICWTESEPAEDGSFTVTSDAGVVQTVKPIPAASTEEAAPAE